MGNEKKDPGGVGVQIESPSPVPSSYGGSAAFNMITNINLPVPLSLEEKKFLLAVERGDLASVKRILQRAHRRRNVNVNCVDSLGRGALTLAIENENLEMVELLVVMNVETKDALLLAINAEFVEAVELLLEHEELIHKDGEPYSWQRVDINTAMFTPDITPLMLAAHKNNYEILKILLDRGATLPMPHDVKCGCEECIRRSSEDSLRHSLARVNEYRALASPSLIALSSQDPLLTAFQLSWELRNLAFAEQECKSQYLELRHQCQNFAVELLDQSRSSQELAIILNYDPESPPYMDGDHMKLTRLELAIDYKQKKFVAHPNIQQLLAAMWYEGVPGFRRKSAAEKIAIIVRTAVLFPFYCMLYMIAPNCETSMFMRKPFMKFLIHASSYLFFLFLLILVSQRAEVQVVLLFGTESMKRALQEELARQRGNGPTYLECLVVIYVIGFIWEETQEIFIEGIRSYLRNMWNFIDFARNFLYCCVVLLRIIAYIQQSSQIAADPSTAYIAREHWDDFDPQLIAEGLFAAANVFSALKLVHLFSINPHLGPLQISLGRMVIDIVKFFFIYSLVLFAFACGLNQLLWYFADLEKSKCYSLKGGLPDWDNQGDACMKWRRFGNLFESSQSLFWASFGMVGLEAFELTGIKSYTRFWGLLMFGSYSVINVIVLLNLLIAMMSNSYAMIEEHSDTEWKFARTRLWMSYFEESSTLPPPFNIFPNMKHLMRLFGKKKKRDLKRESTIRRKEDKERAERYTNVMRALVWRYVSAMHRRMEQDAVTEDDINEVKTEISAMRYELLDIFEKNGMDVSAVDRKEKAVLAKRMKIWERRLMKDFHVAPVEMGEQEEQEEEEEDANPLARFRRVAKKVANNTSSAKWGQVMTSVGVEINSQIGRCRNRDSFRQQQQLQKAMDEARRLVERSPLPRSRSVSPHVEGYTDETTNTLLHLLSQLAEGDETSPGNTLNANDLKSRATTPINLLTAQLQAALSKTPSPRMMKSTKAGDGGLGGLKSPAGSSMGGSRSPGGPMSRLEGPTPAAKSPLASIAGSKSPSPEGTPAPEKKPATLGVRSPPMVKSPPPCKDPPTVQSPPPPPQVQSPPPTIHITRTESQLVKKKSESTEDTKEQELSTVGDPSAPSVVHSDDPEPLVSGVNSPPKVIKRKAPAPERPTGPEDIAVARPVAAKPQPGQGMLPPPPSKEDSASSAPVIPVFSTTPATPLPTHKSRPASPKLVASPPPPPPPTAASPPLVPLIKTELMIDSEPSAAATKPTSAGGSKESLIVGGGDASADAARAASSPPCLRPYRKVEDVTTIKRQPKTGWL
ncbi:transient-receptor-potential-like protein [Anopheles ziemanni]|uniref:transient-receptor-potential-like protein n=1 Tax=Anopheles coustani TaxID=139045 RepID=UPI0026597F7A|nr:transient-receptor-potential-like protein [Anopheles coustani]XP_058173780.1 transient-receptor-potential-like protein [Anopheles ziemanni]